MRFSGKVSCPQATKVQIQRLALTGFMVEIRIVAKLSRTLELAELPEIFLILRPPSGISVFEMLNHLPVLPTTTVWHPS